MLLRVPEATAFPGGRPKALLRPLAEKLLPPAILNRRAAGMPIRVPQVVRFTDAMSDYPPGTKLFLRAEPLHPGATPSLLDLDGHRVTAFLTNSPRWHGCIWRRGVTSEVGVRSGS